MNWKNIKTFMIILMAVANLFLFIMLLTGSNSNIYSGETASNIAKLLSESGIDADKKFFKLETEKAYIYDLDHGSEKAATVAEMLLGSVPSEKFVTPTSVEFFAEDGATLSCGDDLNFVYKSSPESELPELFTGDLPSANAKENAKDLLLSKLCPEGTDIFSFQLIPLGKSEDTDFFTAIQTVDSFEISNHIIICGVKNNDLVFLKGKWCFVPTEIKLSAHLLDSVNILLNERNEGSRIIEGSDYGKNAEVASMKQCYVSRFYGKGSSLTIMPAWCIEWNDGRPAVYYDAVSGNPTIVN